VSTWHAASAAWWSWIGPLSVQCAVLALAFAIADKCLAGRASVRVRAAFGWALLARLALPPGLESPVAVVRLLGEQPVAEETSAILGSQAILALFLVWLAGAVALGTELVVRAGRDRRAWIGSARPADDGLVSLARNAARQLGLRRAPRVLVAAGALGPAAIGLMRPVVVLPDDLVRAARARQLEHVLLHELAHVARRDALSALAWSLARTVLWFHPAVHLYARHAATLREIACDERAASSAGDAQRYRSTLLELARPLASPGPLGASAFFPPEPQILARLRALERLPRSSGARQRAAALATFGVLAACCVPLARPSKPQTFASIDELDGCMRKRFAVMAALAAEARSTPDR
jgi:beta-lactamase regulating signal transducer with metallopeptidase domain